jgi:hypothetical protein
MDKMIIAVDFDGTIVNHEFPEIGEEKTGAFQTLISIKKAGHKLILWTCRNDNDPALHGRRVLTEAVEFCASKGIVFDAVNSNIAGIGFNPYPKIYADLYIDNRAMWNYGFIVDWKRLKQYFGV